MIEENYLVSSLLIEKSLIQVSFPLPKQIYSMVENQSWQELDRYFLLEAQPGGSLHSFLQQFVNFNSIEHIISIRQAPDDEDGIWHDDGSRTLGFTLSLTQEPEKIEGGHLRFRAKGSELYQSFSTRTFGEMLLFKTGIYGYEHMVSAVTKGKRILIAGWCS